MSPACGFSFGPSTRQFAIFVFESASSAANGYRCLPSLPVTETGAPASFVTSPTNSLHLFVLQANEPFFAAKAQSGLPLYFSAVAAMSARVCALVFWARIVGYCFGLPVTCTSILLDQTGGFSRLQKSGPWPKWRGTGLMYST